MTVSGAIPPWDFAIAKDYYESDGMFRAFFDKMATRERSPREGKTTVATVQDDLGIPRKRAVELLRKIAAADCGVFKPGRRGFESRIEWSASVSPIQVAKELQSSREPQATTLPTPKVTEVVSYEFIEQVFQIRPGVAAVVRVPKDTTKDEAEKLANVVRSMWWVKE